MRGRAFPFRVFRAGILTGRLRQPRQNAGQRSMSKTQVTCDNWTGAQGVAPESGEYMDVLSPVNDEVIGRVALSGESDVAAAVARAEAALPAWQAMTTKSRAAVMFRLHHLIDEHKEELAEIVTRENGKNIAEARASVAKGNETVEWACSLPQLSQGKTLQVSRGISCRDSREPLGVVACITPCNFPIMIACWTTPIALTAGNAVILKPSEKVPLTMKRVAELIKEAGVPEGVFQLVNGTAPAVNALCDHPGVRAVTFVGSSHVAEAVSKRCRALNKRCIALGGAKNHLVALPDADNEQAADDIVASAFGCAGQRCMAASVLLLVGDTGDLLERVAAKAGALRGGVAPGEVGAIMDARSRDRMRGYVDRAADAGARLLVDGRPWAARSPGTWFGPTVHAFEDRDQECLRDEIFGPVLSVLRVASWEEALEIENANPFGNAASVYTTDGAAAEWFCQRFRAGMLGVNIGVPVPREPFSFGGMYGTLSKFGDYDITGEDALGFFTDRRKVTTRWAAPKRPRLDDAGDVASFAGRM